MLGVTKYFSDVSPVEKAFGNWLSNDQIMSSQYQSHPSGQCNLPQNKLDNFRLREKDGLEKLHLNCSHEIKNASRQVDIQNLPNQESTVAQVNKLGIKLIKNIDRENGTSQQSHSDQSMKAMFSSGAFECSTPVSNLTHEFDLRNELSCVTDKCKENQKRNNFLGVKRARGIEGTKHEWGTKNKEEKKLFSTIKQRLMNLEKDGEEAINGIVIVEEKVKELLEDARKAVQVFEEMEDKKNGYKCVSQKLAQVGDELTLLLVSSPCSQNSTLKKEDSGDNISEIVDNTISDATNVTLNEKMGESNCNEKQTKNAMDKEISETRQVKNNFIPVQDILNGPSTKINCIEAVTDHAPSPPGRNLKTSFHLDLYAQPTDEPNNDRQVANEKTIQLIHNKHGIGKDDAKQINKIQTTDNTMCESVNELTCSLPSINFQENGPTFSNEVKRAKNSDKFDGMLDDMLLNVRLQKLHNRLKEQNLSTIPMKEQNLPFIPLKEQKASTIKPPSTLHETPKMSRLESIETPKSKVFPGQGACSKQSSSKVEDSSICNLGQSLKNMDKLDSGYKGTLTFVEGSPSLLWFHRDSFSLTKFQSHLESINADKEAAKSKLSPGNDVLARSNVDGKLYRARVEEIFKDKDCLYLVRYIDFGNSEVMSGEELMTCGSDLSSIPEQAVSCCLVDGPQHWRSTEWGSNQMRVFQSIVHQNGGRLVVELRRRQSTEKILDPMYEALVSYRGESIVDSLRKHPNFLHAVLEPQPNRDVCADSEQNSRSFPFAPVGPSPDLELIVPTCESEPVLPSLDIEPIVLSPELEPVCPSSDLKSVVPSPDLKTVSPSPKSEPVGSSPDIEEDVPSPIPSVIMGNAKSKVTNWLENKCQDNYPPSSKSVSVKSFRAKLRPNSVLQSTEKSLSSRESFQVESLSSRESFQVESEESIRVLPVHKVKTLEVEEEDGSFFYFLSAVENPGKFYIHPVQKDTARLDEISSELDSQVLTTPDQKLVVAETVWALRSQRDNRWYRVRVEGRESNKVSIRYIDYGISQESIEVESLHQLPDTWVSQLPGLAVCCHLAGCRPSGKTWHHRATAELEKMVGYERQNRGVVVKKELGSVCVLLVLEDDTMVNEKMLECKFAQWHG